MSQYTIQIDQFLLNSLQPEIDRLNISLLNMEKYGYNNPSMDATKEKLNKLLPIYDFLYEYAHGNEEADIEQLNRLMSFTGTSLLSDKTSQKIITSKRSDIAVNTNYDIDFLRIYVNGEIKTTNVFGTSDDPFELDIFLPRMYKAIEVILTIDGVDFFNSNTTNHVRMSDVILSDYTQEASLTINGYLTTGGPEDYTKTIDMEIKKSTCRPNKIATYFAGGTHERFKITSPYNGGTHDINESTNLTIGPNEGSDVTGIDLNWAWITSTNNDLEERGLYDDPEGDITATIYSKPNDSHLLIVFPGRDMDISQIVEMVLGTEALMTPDLHYGVRDLEGAPVDEQWKYVYFRDLAAFHYTGIRKIQFYIDIDPQP